MRPRPAARFWPSWPPNERSPRSHGTCCAAASSGAPPRTGSDGHGRHRGVGDEAAHTPSISWRSTPLASEHQRPLPVRGPVHPWRSARADAQGLLDHLQRSECPIVHRRHRLIGRLVLFHRIVEALQRLAVLGEITTTLSLLQCIQSRVDILQRSGFRRRQLGRASGRNRTGTSGCGACGACPGWLAGGVAAGCCPLRRGTRRLLTSGHIGRARVRWPSRPHPARTDSVSASLTVGP